jgi:hypothetical protein
MSLTERQGGEGGSSALRRAQESVERWRSRHGGRGVRIPERLWGLAVEAARSEGVGATARCLRLNRLRLARRVGLEPVAKGSGESAAVSSFVELRLSEPRVGCEAVIELSGGDGERLRMVLGDVRQLDVVGLARAFWSRGR